MTPALALVASDPEMLPPALLLAGERQRTARSILEAWRAGKSPNTMRSYEHDLEAAKDEEVAKADAIARLEES
jgi:hypothetical protein